MNVQAETQYWYAIGTDKQGPVSGATLAQYARDGRLRATDLVWCDGMPDWVAAGSMTGLFAPAAGGPTGPIAPTVPAAAIFPCAPLKGASFGLLLTLGLVSFFFTVVGLITIFSAGYDEDQATVGGVIVAIALVVEIGCAVVVGITIYRAWAGIQGLPGVSSTPGKAVGFCFIPFFNFYWVFVAFGKWSREYNAFVRANGLPGAPVASEGLFQALCIMIILGIIPIINWLMAIPNMIVGLICLSTMCRAINYLKAQSEAMVR
jgi:hypothetical protein